MNEQDRKSLRDNYATEYKLLTGIGLVCIEQTRRRINRYQGVARNYIVQVAADYSGIPRDKITGLGKKREVVNIRQMISYLLREMRMTLAEIGTILNQDHTTIMSTVKAVRGYLQVDDEYAAEYQEFKVHCLTRLDGFRQRRQKIDEHQRIAIKSSYKGGKISQTELAEIYDVDQTTIGRICKPRKKTVK